MCLNESKQIWIKIILEFFFENNQMDNNINKIFLWLINETNDLYHNKNDDDKLMD